VDVSQRRATVVKEITRMDDRVALLLDRVLHDAPEGLQEIGASLGRMVLAVADMGVARMEHPCHG
jgi:hypothetical protein